ncbi:hypothetical protein [Asticcacaulis sp. MM231]|uniref:hypothetical protein n=1 Tax=Asticcacaulis sp. MM231 TaxID=3157666 RepID=UPI0032D59D85
MRVELLLRLGRASEALSVIEFYLSAHPDDALARFQLGEVRFSLRQDQAAAFAYRLALAGNLDDLRRNMALKRLDMIVARKRWRFSVGGAISPDSNLNSATNRRRSICSDCRFALMTPRGGIAALASRLTAALSATSA